MPLIRLFIAHSGKAVYSAAMTGIAGKLLILLALLIMPVGMSWAGTSAPVAGHHDRAATPHCPDSAPDSDRLPGIAACTMVCAAALPVIAASAPEPHVVSELPRPAMPKALVGILLEIATPPPRIA